MFKWNKKANIFNISPLNCYFGDIFSFSGLGHKRLLH